jgi:competence ComEA-like helix-hairpin-helix protein
MEFSNITTPRWRTRTRRIACAVLLAGAILPAHAQQPAQDKSAEAFTKVCSTCHDASRILATRRTRTQWEEVIDKMVERGAQGTDEEFAAVEDYLLRNFGRVNVNRAIAADIAMITGITEKDAYAIVSYRKSHGDFADFEALCKVPGIDVEKLKLAQEAVSF